MRSPLINPELDHPHWSTAERRTPYSVIGYYATEQQKVYGAPTDALPAYFFQDVDGVVQHCLPEIRYVATEGSFPHQELRPGEPYPDIVDAALAVNLERYAESALIRFLINDITHTQFVHLTRMWYATLFVPIEYDTTCRMIATILEDYQTYTEWQENKGLANIRGHSNLVVCTSCRQLAGYHGRHGMGPQEAAVGFPTVTLPNCVELANRSRPYHCPDVAPVGIHDVEPTPRHRCKMAVFHHFTSTCLSRYIPICKRKPNDDRVESKEPTFCFQVVPNPLPHAGQVIQPASDVCQIPEQRFTDLPVSALPSRPPALRYNQPPTASQTLPLAGIPSSCMCGSPTINVPTLRNRVASMDLAKASAKPLPSGSLTPQSAKPT